ncbi:MAG TPA: adenylate/guanylate cyclase domain-containing protein, partial [Stellaceae bacterium]|nr:adenylate/guanylate cyclase domain-containing protein [Stellaceae bacterium]
DDYLPKPFNPVILRARMNAGLAKKRLRDLEQTRVRDVFCRFLPEHVVDDVLERTDDDFRLGGVRTVGTVMFNDLRGFTAFAETAEPEEVMTVLREYHTSLGPLVHRYEGTLTRFAGDGLMVFFNDPIPCPDPTARAVRLAVEMREAAQVLAKEWRKRGHEIGFGVGVAQGFATLGQIGFEGQVDYTAIGTVINLAARLCDAARDGQILVSHRVAAGVEEVATVEAVGEIQLKGLTRPGVVHQVIGLR